MMVLAACGGGSNVQPTVAPAATQAPAPTEAPTVATVPTEAPTTAPAATTSTETMTGTGSMTSTESTTSTEEMTGTAPVSGTQGSATGSNVTIKIATQSPLSGGQSALGVAIKNGAQLALEQANAAVTMPGVTFELTPYDDQANPDTGVANATQIVGDPAILCMVGHYNSGVMIPSMEKYHSAGLAAVSPANTNPVVTDRGYAEINRVVGRDDVQGVVGEQFARDELKIKSVYILNDKTAYGEGIAQFFKQAAEKDGIQVLGFEGTDEKSNFDGIITPIIAANPDLIYFGGIYDQGAVFIRQARDRGITAEFMGPDGFDGSDLAKIGGDAVVNMYYSTVAGPPNVYPKAAQFIKDYTDRFKEQVPPFAAQAYDSMNVCIGGIKAAMAAAGKVPTRAQVAKAVRATRGYPGITGDITFNSIGDKESATYFVLQVGSADPTQWNNNKVVKSLDIQAPSE